LTGRQFRQRAWDEWRCIRPPRLQASAKKQVEREKVRRNTVRVKWDARGVSLIDILKGSIKRTVLNAANSSGKSAVDFRKQK
jgi:hypothetical protein